MGFYSAIYFLLSNAVLNVVLVKTVTSRILFSINNQKKNPLENGIFTNIWFSLCMK